MSRIKSLAMLLSAFILVAGIIACGGFGSLFGVENGSLATADSTIPMGIKNFTEQLILGELMAQVIENGTQLSAERVFDLGDTMINHKALTTGEIDLGPHTGIAEALGNTGWHSGQSYHAEPEL